MITWSGTRRVHASAAHTFDVIATHGRENHPRWEKEVVEIRPVTPGPVGLGTRAIMVRKEMGRVRAVEYEVTEFDAGRRIAFHHPDANMDFALSFTVSPATASECDLRVDVRAQPNGALRAIEPLMRLAFPKRSARITDAMVAVVEELAAVPGAK